MYILLTSDAYSGHDANDHPTLTAALDAADHWLRDSATRTEDGFALVIHRGDIVWKGGAFNL